MRLAAGTAMLVVVMDGGKDGLGRDGRRSWPQTDRTRKPGLPGVQRSEWALAGAAGGRQRAPGLLGSGLIWSRRLIQWVGLYQSSQLVGCWTIRARGCCSPRSSLADRMKTPVYFGRLMHARKNESLRLTLISGRSMSVLGTRRRATTATRSPHREQGALSASMGRVVTWPSKKQSLARATSVSDQGPALCWPPGPRGPGLWLVWTGLDACLYSYW